MQRALACLTKVGKSGRLVGVAARSYYQVVRRLKQLADELKPDAAVCSTNGDVDEQDRGWAEGRYTDPVTSQVVCLLVGDIPICVLEVCSRP